MPCPPRPDRGLTLLEMSIALAISAMLGLVAVPSLASWLAHQRVRAVAQNLLTDLGEARQESARLGRPVHVVFRPGESWCYAVSLDAQADCRSPGSGVLKVVGSGARSSVSLVDSAPLAFDGLNGPTIGASGFVRFATTRGEQIQVRVSGVGRPTLCAPDAPAHGLSRC